MRNHLKKKFPLALAILLCFILTACSGSHSNTAGNDWRTSGAVVGSGTITHDGESINVLVAVSESSAAFYRNQPEQVLFDSVSFPFNIPDAAQSFKGISFGDINGDDESDVQVNFSHKNGDTTELIWIWDPAKRYVFREDLSSIIISGGTIDDYAGIWEYQGENLWLKIHDDATWEFVNDQEDVLEYGTLWIDKNGITLHFDGSGDVLELYRTVSGDLIDTENNGTLLPVEAIQPSRPY